jgi:hypothetical protein
MSEKLILSHEKVAFLAHRDLIKRQAQQFKEHRNGLPEWLKNSDDSYTRHEDNDKVDFTGVPIILNFTKDKITCLDFGGADGNTLIDNLLYYGSPDAVKQGKKIDSNKLQGGHGSGGKYYAITQFSKCNVVDYYKGQLTILTLTPDNDFKECVNKKVDVSEAINQLGIGNWQFFLLGSGKEFYNKLKEGKLNLFGWQGIEPVDKKRIENRIEFKKLIMSLQNNLQARFTLKDRDIIILLDGKLFRDRLKPLGVDIDTTIGPYTFDLPNKLGDYKFNTKDQSTLKITFSKERLVGAESSHNILEISAYGKNIAHYSLQEFLSEKKISPFMMAEIEVPELSDYNCVTNARDVLVDNDITEKFKDWCRERLLYVVDIRINEENKKVTNENLNGLSAFINVVLDTLTDLLDEKDLLGINKSNSTTNKNSVEKLNKNNNKKTVTPLNRTPNGDKKTRGKINILISNYSDDPINPGHTYDLLEREPILVQRPEDVDGGIWWLNSQKSYAITFQDLKNPKAKIFYLFIVKEVVLYNNIRNEPEQADTPDKIQNISLNLIDEVFNRVIQRLGIDQEFTDKRPIDRLREVIKNKDKFTINGLSNELEINSNYIGTLFYQNPNLIANFKKKIIKNKDNGKRISVYERISK